MTEFFSSIGSTLFYNAIQIVIGCILSSLIYYFGTKRTLKSNKNIYLNLLMIGLFSVIGMILPLNTFGLIPIFIVLLKVGFRIYTLLPLLISNAIFNTLVPFSDFTFVWRTGIRRVILAFVVAILAGIILRKFEDQGYGLIKSNNMPDKLVIKPEGNIKFLKILGKNLSILVMYLIVGVIVNTIFHKYIWWDMLDLLTKSQYTKFIPRFFSGYNVVNPFFLLTINILFLLMDFIKMSALLTIFKVKGLIIYYAYFAAIAVLLGTSAFL